jgi:putative DNA primase/helicase
LPILVPGPALDSAKRTDIALRIWREARPAAGTLVQTYLKSRRITIPVPPSLRFYARLKHTMGVYLPAMVAAVQDIDGVVVAIHRTYLRSDAHGAHRVSARCGHGLQRFIAYLTELKGIMSEKTIKASLDGAQALDAAALLRSEAERLVKLDRAGYLVERKQVASRCKIPIKELDRLVDDALTLATAAERESLAPPWPEPWPEPVEAGALLDGVHDFIKRFVILDKHALVAVVLWIAFAYCFEIAETSPRLRITSPEKRCGKSRLLDVLNLLCPRPLSASNISPSAIFRVIELERCTLLIDEADSFLRDNEDMRNLINSGHTPEFAFVIRSVLSVDKAWEPKRFSTWCPMVIAGIGKLADTIEDRSIKIAMLRKLRVDKVERLARRNKVAREEAKVLASKLARFAADSLEELGGAEPLIPDVLNDRAVNNWEHLLAVADLAGEDWPERARAAAVVLSGDR